MGRTYCTSRLKKSSKNILLLRATAIFPNLILTDRTLLSKVVSAMMAF